MTRAVSLRVSVIVTTYNRAEHLDRLLSSFNHLAYDEFEVVVVHGPSTDHTAELLAEYAGRLKVIDCPVAHMTLARNLGLAAAAGDVVVFIDDDAIPAEPDWLDRITDAFAADREGRVGAVGGPALHGDTPHYQFRRGLTSAYAFQVFWGDAPNAVQPDGIHWVRRTVGCNSAFRRSALLEVGGFDERITYYADEADTCLRLARRGFDTVHIDGGAVRHYPAQATHLGAPFIRNRRVITKDDTYYCLKNGGGGRLHRLLTTLRLAPRKHFVREMVSHWMQGRLSAPAVIGFFAWQWPAGLAAGVWLGLFRRRGNRQTAATPPPFLRFQKDVPARKLCIGLVTERVPPYAKIGGVERQMYFQAKGLHRLGHEVHLICQSDTPIRREGLGLTLHGIADAEWTNTFLFPGMDTVTRLAGYTTAVSRKFLELARQGITVDVIHACNWDLVGLSIPLMRFHPLVLHPVTPLAEVIETEGWSHNADLDTYVALDRWQVEHADALCCSTWAILDVYRDKMGIDLDRLPPVHKATLGVGPISLGQRPAARAATGKSLLFVGRIEYRKGAHVLLAALPEVLERFPEWRCDLVGEADRADTSGVSLKAQFLERHGGAPWLSRVRFHGTVSDEALAQFYESCDVFVAPSLFESFGLIYAEAMRYGKPVVGCRAGGIPEVVEDGVDGVLVEPGSAPALAEALARLMGDAALRDRIGRAGREKVDRELNHVAMARRTVPVYEDAIGRVGAARREKLLAYLARELDVLKLSRLRQTGRWLAREARPGDPYLMAEEPGAALFLDVEGGSQLSLATLRHDWSGVLAVRIDGQDTATIDLFDAQHRFDVPVEIPVGGSADRRVTVELAVHTDRNPDSKAVQIWLKRLFIDPASEAPRAHPNASAEPNADDDALGGRARVATRAREALTEIAAHILARTPRVPPANALRGWLAHARALAISFRAQPIGGRLLPLKKVAYWFTASAFDRQAKVHEALLAALEEMERAVSTLEADVLRDSTANGRRPDDHLRPGRTGPNVRITSP